MKRNYFFWIVVLTILCMGLTIYSIWDKRKVEPQVGITNFSPNPKAPFPSFISGSGIVEASSDNIAIGTSVNRVVKHIFVTVGQEVNKGDVLFQLDDHDLQVDLNAREVNYEIAKSNFQKLEAMPRKEDLLIAEANLQSAKIAFNQALSQYQMVEGLQSSRALSQQSINQYRFNKEQAEVHLIEAQANLNKVMAGTWQPDLDVSFLEIAQAKISIDRVKADIQKTIIRSPIDGKVLQIRIHEGEYPASVNPSGPLMIVGNTDELFLKVSINQFDTPHFNPDAPAVAYLRGNKQVEFPLAFVRLEPFLVSKQNLTNDITDKVDTRVLQVIYLIKKENHPIFIGQQMDVFIAT